MTGLRRYAKCTSNLFPDLQPTNVCDTASTTPETLLLYSRVGKLPLSGMLIDLNPVFSNVYKAPVA